MSRVDRFHCCCVQKVNAHHLAAVELEQWSVSIFAVKICCFSFMIQVIGMLLWSFQEYMRYVDIVLAKKHTQRGISLWICIIQRFVCLARDFGRESMF